MRVSCAAVDICALRVNCAFFRIDLIKHSLYQIRNGIKQDAFILDNFFIEPQD